MSDPSLLEWHFFVPCRNEQAVIGATMTYLRQRFRAAHVWVIDDGSDDRTATVVRNLRRVEGRHIHLVQRYRPQARTGKEDALNAGYRALKAWQGRHAAPERAVIVVLDAGGRPLWNCLELTAAHFEDPRMGSVQVDVRSNTPRRGWLGWLTARRNDTKPLCGSGQFIRLSALDSLAGPEGRPWRGVPLSAAWHAGLTRDTFVYHQSRAA